eukprot:6491009-Amphidinium_carterae.3
MQDIVQRGEMTIRRIPTTDNPADVLTKHLPAATIISHLERPRLQTTLTSTIGSLLGVPTVNRLTVGMINMVNNSEQQPTQAAEARLGLHLSQAEQYRRRRRHISQDTPRRRKHRAAQQEQLHEQQQQEQLAVRQCNTLALASWSFLASLLCTIILCLHYSYFGSTISPLATARQYIAACYAMAGTGNVGDFTMINGNHVHHLTEETMAQLQQPRMKASTRAVPSTMPTVEPSTATNPVSPPDNRPTSSTAPIPMDVAQGVTADTVDTSADVTESISSGSRASSTVSGETTMSLEQSIWNNLVTQQCSPTIQTLLDSADFYPSSTDKLKAFADIGNMRSIQRDSLIRNPGQWENNTEQHLWWTWLG